MANDGNSRGAGVLLGGSALAVAAYAAMKQSPVSAVKGVDQQTKDILMALAATGNDTLVTLNEALASLNQVKSLIASAGGAIIQGWPENADTVIVDRFFIANLDYGYRLPDIEVPSGFTVFLKGHPTNAGIIYVAESKPNAENINKSWPLLAQESLTLGIKNTKCLYVAGITGGGSFINDSLSIIVEQRRN